MKRLFFLTLICIWFKPSFGQENLKSVLYGEKDLILKSQDGVERIFLDKNGDYYPDFFISDTELKQSDSELFKWSKANVEKFIEIGKVYNLYFVSFSDENYQMLQSKIIETRIESISDKSLNFQSVSVLIHGFRKPFKTRDRSIDSWSYDDNNFVGEIIKSKLANTFIIEIYWDGAYDCCFTRKMKNNKVIFELFEKYATQNAISTGYSLRQIISKLQTDKLNIISHSTGAIVSSTLLFNAYRNEVKSEFKDFNTPDQKLVNHCLMAPAIPSKPYEEYYDRNTDRKYREKDNYTLTVIYNEKDFVLLKKDPEMLVFGPGPMKYGVTTLGCNHKKEIKKLENIFDSKYPVSKIDTKEIGPLKNHLFTYYSSSNNKAFEKWLEEIK